MGRTSGLPAAVATARGPRLEVVRAGIPVSARARPPAAARSPADAEVRRGLRRAERNRACHPRRAG